MNPAKVVMHVVDRNRGDMVLDFFGKRIGQAGEAPHLHPHGQILAFNVTRRYVFRIGIAANNLLLAADAISGAVARFRISRLAIEFYQHGVVDVVLKSTGDSVNVNRMAVRRKLYAARKPRRQILNEFPRRNRMASTYKPGANQLGIRVHRDPGPHVASVTTLARRRRDVLLFGRDERPNFITLDALTRQIHESFVEVFGTSCAEFYEQLGNRVLGDPSHADRCTDRIAFNKSRDHLRPFLIGQLVHISIMQPLKHRVKIKMLVKVAATRISSVGFVQRVSLVLARFLLAPAGLCRLSSDLGALPGRELGRARRSTLQAAQASQFNSSRVLRLDLGGIRLRGLPGRFQHYPIGQRVRIARAVRFLSHSAFSMPALQQPSRVNFKLTHYPKFTENGRQMKPGEGFWKTAGASRYRLYAIDPAAGDAAAQAVVAENGALDTFFVRLKIKNKKITEAETLVCRKSQAVFFAPEKMTSAPAIYSEKVPDAKQSARSQLIRDASAYFTAVQTEGTPDYKEAPLAPDMNRFENGVQTTNVPVMGSPAMSGSEQLDKGVFKGLVIDHRRFPVVDVEHGVVVGMVLMHTNANGQKGAILISEMFKIVAAKIRQVQAVMVNVPDNSDTGWK